MRTTCGPNFIEIGLYLQVLWPPNPPNWAQFGKTPKKRRGIFRVKSRTTNTQKLKVVDPESVDLWSYYALCEILCGPFGWAPGGNLGPRLEIFGKLTDHFGGPPNFRNN